MHCSHIHVLIFHCKTSFERKLEKRAREIRIKGRGEKPQPTLKHRELQAELISRSSTNTSLKVLKTLKLPHLCLDNCNSQGSGEERTQGERSLTDSPHKSSHTTSFSFQQKTECCHEYDQVYTLHRCTAHVLFTQYILLLNGKCHEVSVQEESLKEVLNFSKGFRAPHV